MSKVIVSDDTKIVELQDELAQTNFRLSNLEAKLDQVLNRLNPIQQGRLTALEVKLDRIITHLSPIQQLRLANLESKLDQVFRHLVRQNEGLCKKIHIEEIVEEEHTASESNNKQSSLTKSIGLTPTKLRTFRYDRSAVNLIKYEWLNNKGQPTSPPDIARLDSRSSTPVDPSMKTHEEGSQHDTPLHNHGSELGDDTSSPVSNGVIPSSTVQTDEKSGLDKNQNPLPNGDIPENGRESPTTLEKDKQFGNIRAMSAYVRQRLDSAYLSTRDRQELRILLQLSQFESTLGSALKKDVHSRLNMFSTVVTHGWSAASRITARQTVIHQDMNRKMNDLQITTTNNRFKMSRFHKLAIKSSKKKKH